MQTKIGKTTLSLVTGDIADQDTDAVVTAAHWRLNKGTGTDGTIHTKGGPKVYEECRRIGGCPVGDAVITTGGDLKARHVIHAVGPVYRDGRHGEPEQLRSCYETALRLAEERAVSTISFPAISTGAYGYPMREAARIALSAAGEHLRKDESGIREILFVLASPEALETHSAVLSELFGDRIE